MSRCEVNERPDLHTANLPRPIPWLGTPGPVPLLDAGPAAQPQEPRQPASYGSTCGCHGFLPHRPNTCSETVSTHGPDPEPDDANPRTHTFGTRFTSALASAWGGIARRVFPERTRSGSGLPARKVIRVLVWVRRVSQLAFFGLFIWLLVNTAFRGTFSADAKQPVRLPWPVELFLLSDPFVAAINFLSTHTVYRGLALSLIVLGLTLVFGRVFCGWICPFGTLHHFFGWVGPSRALRGNRRVEANKTHWWQAGKYYLMLAFLGAALAGSVYGGLLDPICVAVRAIGLGVLPGLQYLGVRVGDGLATTNLRSLQATGDEVQDLLSRHVWTSQQGYFHQTWFVLFLFIAILFMNRFIPRFWCRALCPLGAFLGVFSAQAVL